MLQSNFVSLSSQPNDFFAYQLKAFQVWLVRGLESRRPPEQLPIVLQVTVLSEHLQTDFGKLIVIMMSGSDPLPSLLSITLKTIYCHELDPLTLNVIMTLTVPKSVQGCPLNCGLVFSESGDQLYHWSRHMLMFVITTVWVILPVNLYNCG